LPDVRIVGQQDLEAFILDCQARKLSPVTIRKYYGSLKTFFNWMDRHGYLPNGNPLSGMQPPRIPRRERQLPGESDLHRLLSAVSPQHYFRDRAILLLVLDGNLRLDEARTLRLDRVSIPHQTIVVTGKGRKDRTIHLDVQSFRALLAYLDRERPESANPYVFLTKQGEPLSYLGFRNIVYRLKDRTGFPGNWHTLRHIGSTMDAVAGMNPFDLQRKLGHTTIQQTLNYVHAADQLKAPARAYGTADYLLGMRKGPSEEDP
jgi:integrase